MDYLHRFWTRLADLFVRYRWVGWVVFCFMSVMAVVGHMSPDRAPRQPSSQPDATDESESDRENPRLAFQNWSSDFGVRRTDCFVVLDAHDMLTRTNLKAVRAIAAAFEQLDSVDSLFWLEKLPGLNVFGVAAELVPPNDASEERIRQARRQVLEHPLLAGHWISEDGTTAVMTLAFDWLEISSDEDVSSALAAQTRSVLDDHPKSDIRVRFTGDVPLFLAQENSFRRNESKFRIIGYVMALIVAVVLFRSVAPVIITSAAPAVGIFWSMGLLKFFQVEINPLTNVVLPVLLAMVGIADGIHLIVHVRQQRAGGASIENAVASALKNVGAACALTSLTTAVGFCSLMLAHSEFVISFGRACALGVLFMFLAVVTTIPLLCLTRLGRGVHQGYERDWIGRGLRHWSWIIEHVLDRRRLVSGLGIAATAALGLVTLTLRPDTRIANALPSSSEAYQALAHCDQQLGGIELARVVYEWPASCPTDSPRIAHAVQDIQQILDDEPLIGNPISIRSVLALFPGDVNDLAGRMEFAELLPDSVRDIFLNGELRRGLVSMRVQDRGLAVYEPIFRRIETKLAALPADHPGFSFELTGDPVHRGAEMYQIVKDLAVSLGTASVVILLVMALAYRSWRLGLITVVPNLFPLAATGALLVLMRHPLDMASVCAFTVCLGIAVDDTIHFLTRYRQLRADGLQVDDAIRHGFIQVGAALVMTTIIMVVGFGAVLTSDLPSQRTFAAMACCTITTALLGDVIFLPAMLGWLVPSPRPRVE